MNKNIMQNIGYLAFVMVILLFQGCVKRPLENRGAYGHVEIVLDWNGKGAPVETMNYMFYNERGELMREVAGNAISMKCQLPVGEYNFIVYNPKADRVVYRNINDYMKAEAFTPLLISDQHSTLIGQPEAVYAVGRFKEFEKISVTKAGNVKATAVPKRLTKDVILRFKTDADMNIEDVSGVMRNISSSAFLANARYTPASYSVDYQAKLDKANVFLVGIKVFNVISKEESSELDVVMRNSKGDIHTGKIDLTKVIVDIINNNGGVTPIEIPIEITLSMTEVGNLSATVKPWDNSGTGGGAPRP